MVVYNVIPDVWGASFLSFQTGEMANHIGLIQLRIPRVWKGEGSSLSGHAEVRECQRGGKIQCINCIHSFGSCEGFNLTVL